MTNSTISAQLLSSSIQALSANMEFARAAGDEAEVQAYSAALEILINHLNRNAATIEAEAAAEAAEAAEAPKKMEVVTINGTFAGDYDVAVHRADCKDVKKAIRGRDWFKESVETKRDLWMDYNADFFNESGEDAAWPMHFHACTAGLPDGGHYTKC